MVIEIEEKCLELIEEEKYCNFFNNLAYYINNGRNYIYMKKEMLEMLYKAEKIDSNVKVLYKKHFDSSFEDLEIINSVSQKVIVINEKNTKVKKEGSDIIIPIDVAIDIQIFDNKSNLICENLSDCNFFMNIAKIFLKQKAISNINIALEKTNGGGDTISEVCKEKEDMQEISLIVTDTDQRFKGDAKGTTIKKLLKTKKEENFLLEIYCLDVHEIENLIPLKLIENYYKESKTETPKRKLIELLKSFNVNELNDSPLAFFDMKNGIRLKKWNENEKFKEYWKNELEKIKFIYDESSDIVDGFGGNLLRKITPFLERKMGEENFQEDNINDYMLKTWNDIGEKIYSYGCARKKRFC